MARTFQLSELRTKARERADMVGSNFVTDSELNGYINASAAELYDMLVDARGLWYYGTEATVATVADTKTSSLAASFYKLIGMEVTLGGVTIPIKRLNWTEGTRYRNAAGGWAGGWSNGTDIRYELAAGSVYWFPTPKAAHTVTYWYVPSHTVMTADGDTFDGVNGWEEYIVVDAAIKMITKEEGDTRTLERAKDDLKARIHKLAEEVDHGYPETIVDVDPEFDSGILHDYWR